MFVVIPHYQPGAFEVSPAYNGSAAHAAAAGIRRLQDLDNGQTIHYHPLTGATVQVGWIFVRKVTGLDSVTGQPNAFQSYVPAGDPLALPAQFQGYLEVTFPAP